jgi:hypothetical protein
MEDAHLLIDKKTREGADMHLAGRTERLDGLISRENIWIDAGPATATDIGSRNEPPTDSSVSRPSAAAGWPDASHAGQLRPIARRFGTEQGGR